MQCASCGATLAVSRLALAHASVGTLEAALHAHRQRPSPEVVRARLDEQSRDLPRRRAWARQMQQEADAQGGVEHDPSPLLEQIRGWSRWQIALAALAVLLLLWFA